MKRNFSLLAAVLAMAVDGAGCGSTTSTGWISDSMCGAKHMGTGADCVKKCIEGGMKPVFVDPSKTGVEHRQPRCGEGGLLRRSRDRDGDQDAANKSMHIDSIAAAK